MTYTVKQFTHDELVHLSQSSGVPMRILTKAQLVTDSAGVICFKPDPMYRWLADNINLNNFWSASGSHDFPLESMEVMYMGMGYSVYNLTEIFGEIWDERGERAGE